MTFRYVSTISMPLQKAVGCILTVLLVLPASLSFPEFAYAVTCGTGSNITFTDIGGGQCRGYITTTGASAPSPSPPIGRPPTPSRSSAGVGAERGQRQVPTWVLEAAAGDTPRRLTLI
jgi:hypothetical protein